jgi:hypothetical protein
VGDGDGIDPQEVLRLLNPVAQEDKDVARRTKGASPGLPIRRLTAEAIGGSMTHSASPGGGRSPW